MFVEINKMPLSVQQWIQTQYHLQETPQGLFKPIYKPPHQPNPSQNDTFRLINLLFHIYFSVSVRDPENGV